MPSSKKISVIGEYKGYIGSGAPVYVHLQAPETYRDLVVPLVLQKLQNRNHGRIYFQKDCIIVGGGKRRPIKFLNLANPSTDPEKLVEEIVSMALLRETT